MEEKKKPNLTMLGYISANIGGDRRYTQKLEVNLHDGELRITISLRDSVPSGGMDTLGGGLMWTDTASSEATGKDVAELAKSTMMLLKHYLKNTADTIKQHGKPTKNFVFIGASTKGVSMKLLQEALAEAGVGGVKDEKKTE